MNWIREMAVGMKRVNTVLKIFCEIESTDLVADSLWRVVRERKVSMMTPSFLS